LKYLEKNPPDNEGKINTGMQRLEFVATMSVTPRKTI
jgi:hypothetical protein